MSLSNQTIDFKLKALLASKTKEHLLQIIKDYNEYCKANDLKENILRGYSKKPYNTKEGLIDFLLERLSDEEKGGILQKIENTYLEDLFKAAQAYFQDENQREKLQTITPLKNGLNLKFKGWQWENEITLELSSNDSLANYDCTCRTGRMEGFCPHLSTGILALLKEGKFDQETFPFEIPASVLKEIQQLEVERKLFEDVDVEKADIVLGDDYLISVDGSLVTMKWGGSRAGKTTKDVTMEKKPISVELWVAKKVVEKIIAPLKDHIQPREVFKDDFGVVPVILENEKLVKKLITKFDIKNKENDTNLPITEEGLEKFLKKHL